jgi:hypothetical protein
MNGYDGFTVGFVACQKTINKGSKEMLKIKSY